MSDSQRRAAGRRLADARIKAGLTQAGLGSSVGVSGPRISHFESGHAYPKETLRRQIAKAVHMQVEDLFDDGIASTPLRQTPARKRRVISRNTNQALIRLIEQMDAKQQALAMAVLRVISRVNLR